MKARQFAQHEKIVVKQEIDPACYNTYYVGNGGFPWLVKKGTYHHQDPFSDNPTDLSTPDIYEEVNLDVEVVVVSDLETLASSTFSKSYANVLATAWRNGFDFGDLRSSLHSDKVAVVKGAGKEYGIFTRRTPTSDLLLDLRRALGVVWLASKINPDTELYVVETLISKIKHHKLRAGDWNKLNAISILLSLQEIYGVEIPWGSLEIDTHEQEDHMSKSLTKLAQVGCASGTGIYLFDVGPTMTVTVSYNGLCRKLVEMMKERHNGIQ